MIPTLRFRWLKCASNTHAEPNLANTYGSKLVLQQWWEEHEYIGDMKVGSKGEWRDIPAEELP